MVHLYLLFLIVEDGKVPSHCRVLFKPSTHSKFLSSRKKVELLAYQQEYPQQKQALGQRKICKAECTLLEKRQVQKHLLMEMEDLTVYPKAAFGRCICSPSHHFLLMQKPRDYVCALILHLQKVDPQRTPNMTQQEKWAWECFLETRDTLQLFCINGWIEHFQKHVDGFIQKRLAEAAKIMMVLEKGEEYTIHLHGL
jgi:hypothetical protein